METSPNASPNAVHRMNPAGQPANVEQQRLLANEAVAYVNGNAALGIGADGSSIQPAVEQPEAEQFAMLEGNPPKAGTSFTAKFREFLSNTFQSFKNFFSSDSLKNYFTGYSFKNFFSGAWEKLASFFRLEDIKLPEGGPEEGAPVGGGAGPNAAERASLQEFLKLMNTTTATGVDISNAFFNILNENDQQAVKLELWTTEGHSNEELPDDWAGDLIRNLAAPEDATDPQIVRAAVEAVLARPAPIAN